MCFSPEVDVAVGLAVGVVAVDALRHNPGPRTLPLALLPALFAFHTLTEAFVWWGADGTVTRFVADAAAQTYIFVAFVVLPALVPIAIALLEPAGWRRLLMMVPIVAGLIAAGIYLGTMVTGNASAVACDAYIDYRMVDAPGMAGALYLVATCGALLLSSLRPLRLWGLLNAVVVAGLAFWAAQALPSVWCLWAAATSVFIAYLLRSLRHEHDRDSMWPWEKGSQNRRVAVVSSVARN